MCVHVCCLLDFQTIKFVLCSGKFLIRRLSVIYRIILTVLEFDQLIGYLRKLKCTTLHTKHACMVITIIHKWLYQYHDYYT